MTTRTDRQEPSLPQPASPAAALPAANAPDDRDSHPHPRPFTGFGMLLRKEMLRFWKVSFQTLAAPILTSVLYLVIFAQALQQHGEVYPGVSYTAFLIPGLVMMSVLQNAFANSSSSLIQSRVTGNLVFVLLPPISPGTFFLAYVIGAMLRGLAVGAGVFGVCFWFAEPHFAHPEWVAVFAVLGSAILGAFGVIAGIVAQKFDQLAAFQNFLIMPATMLSGVFYSIHSLPPVWKEVSHYNPFFYMIDGFRYGFFGQADLSPWVSVEIVAACFSLLSVVALALLKSGYKLRT